MSKAWDKDKTLEFPSGIEPKIFRFPKPNPELSNYHWETQNQWTHKHLKDPF